MKYFYVFFIYLNLAFGQNAILNSPFDPNLICPQTDSNGYSVDGFPGTPYKITPFVAQPIHKVCLIVFVFIHI
jgi:hypothetical protein